MKNLEVLSRKGWALNHGFILAGSILPSVGLALRLGRCIGGIVGLIIAGMWCFAGGLCLIFIPVCRKLSQK
jgi:TRAP-type C4-dicarboxylate transport system permease large subunit